MSTLSLPLRPNLEQLKTQARELLDAFRRLDPDAAARFAEHHPARQRQFALHDAQLVLARQYGFAHWAKLREEVERLTSRFTERLARFVIDATGRDVVRARNALAMEPALAQSDVWAALVLGDLPAIRRQVERDAAWVRAKGGPRGDWTPLLYLSFSCFQMEGAEALARFAACAQILLEAGADANVSWQDSDWPGAPLKALYGATGANDNPALARLLLEAGAEVDDGESIFHAVQFDHRECMDLLREFGASLGRHPLWKKTPLVFLLGEFNHSAATLRGIRWLLDHGCDPNIACEDHDVTALHVAIAQNQKRELIRWLLEAGADPNRADKNGALPLKLAYGAGRKDIVELLLQYGANEVELTPKERFFGAALSGDVAAAASILRKHADLLQSFTEEDRLALNRAAQRGDSAAVQTLLDLGFDISFKGESRWGATPLHLAAWFGQPEIVALLLARGARIDLRANPPQESFPLDWAAHGSGHCQTTTGRYPELVRALLAAGAKPAAQQAELASAEVAEILYAALAGPGG